MPQEAVPVVDRRGLLKQIGSMGAVTALAGCSTNNLPGVEEGASNNSDWPPQSSRVEFTHSASTPDDTKAMILSAWVEQAQQYYNDVTTAVTSVPGGNGLVMENELFNGPSDGSRIGISNLNTFCINAFIRQQESQYDSPAVFTHLMGTQSVTRGVFVSQHTQDVTDNWQWTWDDFVNAVLEQGNDFVVGQSAIDTALPAYLIERIDSRLSPGDINVVAYPGGGEVRSAVLREEVDAVFFSFSGNYPRQDYYKCQWIWADDRYSDYLQAARQWEPDLRTIMKTELPQQELREANNLIMDQRSLFSAPDISESAIQNHMDVLNQCSNSEELRQTIIEQLGSPLAFTSTSRDALTTFVEEKSQAFQNNLEFLNNVFGQSSTDTDSTQTS